MLIAITSSHQAETTCPIKSNWEKQWEAVKEVSSSAAFTGGISLSLALWIIELAPVEKILFPDILSLPATECQANVQNSHGRVLLPGSCRSNWGKFLNFLIMALWQHEPEEPIASLGRSCRRIPCFALPDACQCNNLRVSQFGCNFLRCLGLAIVPEYAKINFVQICGFTVVVGFASEVWGALLWTQLWHQRRSLFSNTSLGAEMTVPCYSIAVECLHPAA